MSASSSRNARRAPAENDGYESDIYGADDDNVILDESGNGGRPNGARLSSEKYQPGAVRRVSLENFVTYSKATFYPGPKLNMIIEPNGTGKSSLVCAICLGLAYPTNVLGRASSFGEFVKHGQEEAFVEVELHGGEGQDNLVIRLRITKENNRSFWVNGQSKPIKEVQRLVREKRIQIDNLCQFLPQDKVAEFAALNSVDLLTKTLQAAAPPVMMEWQNNLKEKYKKQVEIRQWVHENAEALKIKESGQQTLQADVEKMQERKEIQAGIDDLEKALKYRKYMDARQAYRDARVGVKRGDAKLKRLQESCAPALQAVSDKEAYQDQIEAVITDRTAAVRSAENAAQTALEQADATETNIEGAMSKKNAEINSLQNLKKTLGAVRTKITNLEAKYKNEPKEFNANDWNIKIREQEHLARDKTTELRETTREFENLKAKGKVLHSQRTALITQRKELDSQEGLMFLHLERISPDAARGWKWLEEHMDEFSKPVFGPPLLSCSIKDKRFSDLVQAGLPETEFICFTTQTREDHKKLSNHFFKELKIRATIRTCVTPLQNYKNPYPKETVERLGFDGYALDFIDGPEPVLAMLCNSAKLHASVVGLKDIPDDKYDQTIQELDYVGSIAAGKQVYRIQRRREYGPDAVSTRVQQVGRAKYWTDDPVDKEAGAVLDRKIRELSADIDEKKAVFGEMKTKVEDLKTSLGEVEEKLKDMEKAKKELQKEFTAWQSLPEKIEREKETLNQRMEELAAARKRIQDVDDDLDQIALRGVELALRHQQTISALREAQEALLETQILYAEAQSEVRALKAANAEIQKKLEDERTALRALKAQIEPLKNAARDAMAVIAELVFRDKDHEQAVEDLAQSTPMEELGGEIEAQQAKLDVIRMNNPRALEEFEKLAGEIEGLRRKKADKDKELADLEAKITELREQWEPGLDRVVGQINDAFSYNFEQINCAGEVGVHKDEDFDKWAIEIKVRFRPGETLQRLDQHRQSGGERAVSTIFYLMSLQSLAQAPFRVVDEINQGMDPRNERMVHERMVEIACREHTSQYFLITPKLLSRLRYDEGMRVLCIASGPKMPVDGAAKMEMAKFAGMQRAYIARLRGARQATARA